MSYRLERLLTPQQVRCLLDELCVDLGFCLPPDEILRLMEAHPLDAREFADEVFRAEGMAPGNMRLWRQVRDKIHVHFQRATQAAAADEEGRRR